MTGETQRLAVRVQCIHCHTRLAGWLGFTDTLQVVDSGGFMLFNTGAVCDACLRARYGSDGTEEAVPERIPAIADLFVRYMDGEEK